MEDRRNPAGGASPVPGIPPPRDVGVVIPAAGAGVRFGRRKAFLEIGGRPLAFHSLRTFASIEDVLEIALVVAAADIDEAREAVGSWPLGQELRGFEPPRVQVVPGGERRQDSVWRGLEALSPECRSILVHDAARPLVPAEDVRKVIAAVRRHGAAVLGYPATDSVKEEQDGFVGRELPRERIWLVQTPQGARAELLRKAFEEGSRSGRTVTDEVGLLFAADVPVRLVEGRRTNIKITFPEDTALAEFFLGISGQRP